MRMVEVDDKGEIKALPAAPIEPELRVKLVQVDIPFWSLAGFLIKLFFAAIPVAIIGLILWAVGAGIAREW